MASWNFNKLPKETFNDVLEAFRVSDIDILVKYHNDYKLSSNNYCCSPDEAIMNWYGWAIEKGLIYEIK